MEIKVGILISYDYEYAVEAVRCVYNGADRIVLALDKNLKTWSGGSFTIEEHFFEMLRKLDKKQKIEIYRDNFYAPELSAMENETRERNMLAEYMGKEGWHIQIDSDEYFIDFDGFVHYLHSLEPLISRKKIVVMTRWITLFKRDGNGYYVVKSSVKESIPTVTNYPCYVKARNNDDREIVFVDSGFEMLHESWSRSKKEIAQKIDNWGHNNDFDTAAYLGFWESVNRYNYAYIRNFHPLPWMKNVWDSLEFTEGDITCLIARYKGQANGTMEKGKKDFRKAIRDKRLFYRGIRFLLRKLKK